MVAKKKNLNSNLLSIKDDGFCLWKTVLFTQSVKYAWIALGLIHAKPETLARRPK